MLATTLKFFVMAAYKCKNFPNILSFSRNFAKNFNGLYKVTVRNNSFFNYLSKETVHNETDYEYEKTNDPNDWKYVERLMPLKTVPIPTVKDKYPSGWRPMKEEALKHPYFVERSKNHMLSVYLKIMDRGQVKLTKVTKVHGDLWLLHDELKQHIESEVGKRIPSYVHEGNNAILFKGDYVYYAEQWLLSKGF